MSDYPLKQVIVVRKDLKMRRGKESAQVAHASVGVVKENFDNPLVQTWFERLGPKIVVAVDSEDELCELWLRAKEGGFLNFLVEDLGFTEFNGQKTLTTLAIGPAEIDDLDEITGHLPLR